MAYKVYYEGRSINKLQNGAIPLIFKIGKIRNIRFVGNLILNMQKKIFLMMTSLLWHHLVTKHCLSVYYLLHQFSIITHNW